MQSDRGHCREKEQLIFGPAVPGVTRTCSRYSKQQSLPARMHRRRTQTSSYVCTPRRGSDNGSGYHDGRVDADASSLVHAFLSIPEKKSLPKRTISRHGKVRCLSNERRQGEDEFGYAEVHVIARAQDDVGSGAAVEGRCGISDAMTLLVSALSARRYGCGVY
ncbi:hypothetical protein FA95DRAFT_1394523 [Auriscalpium vulgare]|uniref:Uncharacterized protein n=1 Tax=Auriscalpium vulgare TaxID=40419 RepID=A0ACB8RQE0_9AGAM|nr:hypothetical protein FA95DRAFT_1394523 [Auriscalpium vulgare]